MFPCFYIRNTRGLELELAPILDEASSSSPPPVTKCLEPSIYSISSKSHRAHIKKQKAIIMLKTNDQISQSLN
jgi:hypothetical protein